MKRSQKNRIFIAAILLLPAGFGIWWWQQWPVYERRRQLAAAERAMAANNWTKAEEVLQRLVKEDPDRLRTQFLYAQVTRHLGWVKESEAALERAADLGLPETDRRREVGLLWAGRDFGQAREALEQVLQERPDDPEVLQALARGYAKSNRWADADQAYTRWLELEPDKTPVLLERGRARLEARDFEKAAEDFEEIVRRLPEHFQARILLAHCLLSNAKMSEAEAELRVCRELRPETVEPLVGLAACAVDRGDLNQAQALLRKALALDPNSVIALNEQGDLYLVRQRYDLAIAAFDRVVRLDPRDKAAHLKLAQALRKSGDLKRAEQHVRRFQELDREEEDRLREARQIR